MQSHRAAVPSCTAVQARLAHSPLEQVDGVLGVGAVGGSAPSCPRSPWDAAAVGIARCDGSQTGSQGMRGAAGPHICLFLRTRLSPHSYGPPAPSLKFQPQTLQTNSKESSGSSQAARPQRSNRTLGDAGPHSTPLPPHPSAYHDAGEQTDPLPAVGVRHHVPVADGEEGDGDEPHGPQEVAGHLLLVVVPARGRAQPSARCHALGCATRRSVALPGGLGGSPKGPGDPAQPWGRTPTRCCGAKLGSGDMRGAAG